jgi:MFS family permease
MTTATVEDRTRWGVVALGFLSGVVGMFQTAKMSVALVDVQRDVGLSLVAASWSVTAVSLTGALFGIQAGRISEDFGIVRTLVFALLLSAAAGLATATVSDPTVFFAARVVEGLGYLLVCAAAPAMMAFAAAPKDRGVALSIWGAFVPISVSLMSIVGPAVVIAAGWRVLFLASAGTAVAMAALVAVAAGPGHSPPGGRFGARLVAVVRETPGDLARLYGSRRATGLGIAFMAFAATQVGFIALMPTFLVVERSMDIVTVGLVLSATTPFSVVGTVIAGVLQRFGAPDAPVAVAGFAASAATGAAFFGVEPDLTVLIAVGAAFFTAGGTVAAIAFASLPKLATASLGIPLLSGLLVQFGNVGALLGAPVLASVAEGIGWAAVPLALAAMNALGIAGILLGRR